MTPVIRPATPQDAPGIALVHVASWRTTYKGIMPDEMLANLSVERRESVWRDMLSNPASQTFVYIAEMDRQIVGFASGGPERSEHPIYKGELSAIYLLLDVQRQGIGRKLAEAVVQRLIELGHETMLIWVAAKNPATHFYAALGGVPVAHKQEEIGGAMIEEIAYGYDDIRSIIRSG
jgi:GNAT superfamily N-acetyltransferase